MSREVSKAPYNFIELDKFILDRCADENEIINHDKYYDNLNTGYIDYEIETITPLHISSGREKTSNEKESSDGRTVPNNESQLFKNPQGQYVIPGNTIRGMTRFNASIFSLASVINESIKKRDIVNQRFFYRTFASIDKDMREWYARKTGLKVVAGKDSTYTVLEKVKAGYMRKHGEDYMITPAVELGNRSYTPIHEYILRKRRIKGINYMYQDGLRLEDYKNKKELKDKRNGGYRPYFTKINYSTNGTKPIIDIRGKFTGYLINSNYIDGKVHHYLVFEEDKNSEGICVKKEQAELYIDDMKYTQKQNPNNSNVDQRYKFYDLPKDNEVKPVFYVKDGDTLIFGFTPYLRIPADGDIYNGIPETHREYKGRDFVDSIFGWLDFRTKVSFLDALCQNPEVSVVEYKMVLGQPKPSWYRGYVSQKKDGTLNSYCSDNFEIRGRKFYWLKKSADVEAMQSSLPAPGKIDRISTKMYCYKENTRFEGRVLFENLSDEELGLLLYSLKQGDTEGYFNIGMGKPYGLGKCRIRIKRLVLHDIRAKYMSFRNNYEKNGDINKYVSAFKNYVKNHYNAQINDVNEIKSYKEYLLSKRILKNEQTRYMKVKEFAKKAELPSLEDVINGKSFSNKLGNEDHDHKRLGNTNE